MTTNKRGADLVVEALRAGGVDTIFTLSGNHIMSLFDAAVDGPRLIHTRHEAAAVHMADAYGRLTGKPGVAMATGGPGHANAAAGLYSALAAESPMVLLSGHAPTDQLGLGAFQELPQAEMAAPVTKSSAMVPLASELAPQTAFALDLAVAGRPGPVHLSLPSDLIDNPVADVDLHSDRDPGAIDPQVPATDEIDKIRQLLDAAERPLLIGGPALARAPRLQGFKKIASALGVPAVTMESPRGLNDPSLGAFAEVLCQADLIVLVCKPMDFTVGFGHAPTVDAGCKIVTLDPSATQRGLVAERGASGLAIAADPDAALDGLAAINVDRGAAWSGWREDVSAAITYRPAAWQEPQQVPEGSVHPLAICRSVARVLKAHPDTILICDGGEIGQWVQTVPHDRRLTNSVSGAIGACLPYAIAARVVDQQAPVIAAMGDGTVGFHLAEFDTAVRYNLPIVVIVGNDACWNAEHQIQLRDYGPNRTHSCDLLPTRYDRVVEAMGGHGIYVDDASQMDDALAAALQSGRPTCINVALAGQAAPKLRRPK